MPESDVDKMFDESLRSVLAQVRQLRDHVIYNRRVNSKLQQKRVSFNKITASLYALEDSSDAIGTYPKVAKGLSRNELYLLVYGLVQALYLQQQSVHALSTCLKVDGPSKDAPGYKEASLVRTRIAHLVHTNSKELKDKSHIIAQFTLTPFAFDIVISFRMRLIPTGKACQSMSMYQS